MNVPNLDNCDDDELDSFIGDNYYENHPAVIYACIVQITRKLRKVGDIQTAMGLEHVLDKLYGQLSEEERW